VFSHNKDLTLSVLSFSLQEKVFNQERSKADLTLTPQPNQEQEGKTSIYRMG